MAQDRPHHKILDARGKLVGYLAPTLDVEGSWSVYGPDRSRRAMIQPEGESGRFQVVVLKAEGATDSDDEDGVALKHARQLRGAIALALGLEGVPKLDPPVP